MDKRTINEQSYLSPARAPYEKREREKKEERIKIADRLRRLRADSLLRNYSLRSSPQYYSISQRLGEAVFVTK